MSIDIRELRALAVLSDHLHFGRAAEALHISQPALSKQIRRMEEKIGGRLLTRHTRGLSLTPAGRVLRARARSILSDVELAEQMSRLALRGEAGVLRIGCGLASLTSGLPETVRRFRKRYPNVHITLRDMSTSAQQQALRQHEIDVGFLRLPVQPEGLDVTPVLDERLLMVWSAERRINSAAGLASLSSEAFITCSRPTSASYYEHILTTCRAAGFTPLIVQETNQLFATLHLVRAGVGVSLVPSSARLMRVPQLRFGETGVDEARWSVGMAVRSPDSQSPLVSNFTGLAKEAFSVAKETRAETTR